MAEPVTAEAQQYRLRVEVAEKERDEQLALTAELKATTDKQIEQLQTAKCVLEEEKATVLRAETARAEEAAELRLQLVEAQRTAEEEPQLRVLSPPRAAATRRTAAAA